ncbi:MAG: c-type cytochrome [Niabella sp.]
MSIYKHTFQRLLLLTITLLVVSIFTYAQDDAGVAEGKQLFVSKCQACHAGDMKSNSTGPALFGVESQWPEKEKLHEWIRNNVKLTASGYPLAVEASKLTPTVMQTFPDLTDAQIDNILAYIDAKGSGKLDAAAAATAGGAAGGEAKASDGQNNLIFGIISLIFALVAVVLIFVNRNLKKITDEADGIVGIPEIPVYRNKRYLATAAIVLFIVSGYFFTKGMININRQINYEPKQPIFYSHKVHAGINQINCLYCHGNAWEGKTAAIPSVNVCMNCHKTITKYNGEQLVDSRGNKVDGSAEIAKLFEYAGFDPAKPNDWDASQAKPIEWVRIHNLPDHVYFNHSQHVRVGNVQCQTCHGEITAMDEVKQFSELSMGWCVNCHRQTAVNFNTDSTKGNQFYSIYEKFHDDIKAGKMDSVTVKDIGGLECQKCHY